MGREYKDSGIEWIGRIPKEWKVSLLSTLFYEHSEKNTGLKETNLLSLSYGKIIRKNINDNGGLLPESFEGYNIIQPEDIVFRLTDLQNDKRSLRTGLCFEDGIITSAYTTIRKRDNHINTSYFHYLFHSCDECKIFYGIGNGVRQSMNYQDLRKLEIIVPPITEQQRIAEYLDYKCGEIDKLVELQDEMIKKLNEYKQSVITEAVTKGLNPNAKLVPSGIDWIGEIPEGWEAKSIKRLMLLYAGATPKSDKDELWDGDIPWITPADYKTEDVYVSGGRRNISQKGLLSCATTILPINSIVFSKRAPIGLVALNKIPLCTNQGCIGCVPNKQKADSKYFYFVLSIFTEQFELFGSGTTFKEISSNNFANFIIPVPPLPEQRSIAAFLDKKCAEIDNLISLKQQKIERLKEYKKSIIYEAVTGKKEIL